MRRLLCIGLGLVAFPLWATDFAQSLSDAAVERTSHRVFYDGRYINIAYPGGDVPEDIGVCTDVVIRAYRSLGIDLQQKVHEDISANFSAYPSKRIWGLTRPDTNIDHRRVPNLRAFFERNGESLATSDNGADYLPGDIVTWRLPNNLPHIGIVVEDRSEDGERPLIVHNIGAGPKMDDMLFLFDITGHYRYQPTLD
uniref:DUF1287 domain-containing protein n=1 Tax=Thaumasiovibrio occultus TaxID=1891184 RepID=UPI000B350DC1|nr:DUF1287 domain-containing protein [Thaumasiovibrio occultus]